MPIEIQLTQKATRIESLTGGFVQYFDNKFIEKIEWFGKSFKIGTSIIRVNDGKVLEVDEHDFYGACVIYFYDKLPREFDSNLIRFDIVYNSQYGIPISNDGTKLFVSSSYDKIRDVKQGLYAHDVETGYLLWRVNKGNIGNVFVYDDYLVFLNGYDAVYKVNIDNGEVLEKMKSSTVNQIFDLGTPYVLADATVGNLKVIDTEKMLVVKKYTPKITNPLKCGGYLITNTTLQGNTLTIFGYEYPPNTKINPGNNFGWPFERVIDTDFLQ